MLRWTSLATSSKAQQASACDQVRIDVTPLPNCTLQCYRRPSRHCCQINADLALWCHGGQTQIASMSTEIDLCDTAFSQRLHFADARCGQKNAHLHFAGHMLHLQNVVSKQACGCLLICVWLSRRHIRLGISCLEDVFAIYKHTSGHLLKVCISSDSIITL